MDSPRSIRSVRAILVFSITAAVLLAPPALRALSQLDSPVDEVILQTTAEYEDIAVGQKAQANRFILTPDSCFFYPKGPKLTGSTASTIPGAEFNGGNTFATVTDIKNPGQKILWPLMPANTGAVSIDVFLETANPGAELMIRLGDLTQTVTTTSSDGTTAQSWTLNANLLQAGVSEAAIQFLEIELVDLHGAPEAGDIHKIEINGAALLDAYLLRARWRPYAVHGRLKSSSLTASGLGHDLYIVEMRPDFSAAEDLSFYAPVTTKFGYYGVSYTPGATPGDHNFTVEDAANFSMWSYSANEAQPPVAERSHLLSLGPGLQVFDGYGHEGSGVKPRDGNPWDGLLLDHLVLALRMEPHVVADEYRYRTYLGYYWDEAAAEWKLYASGRDYLDDQELASEGPGFATPNSFVEVPGGVTAQRTAQVKRSLDYRGWIRDENGAWHAIDQLTGSPNPSNVRSKDWSTSADGWLRMTMGGLVHRRWLSNSVLRTITPIAPLPDFMAPAKLAPLDTEPVSIELERAIVRSDGTLEIDFTTAGLSAPAVANLYYGDEDGLTLIYEKGAFPDEWDAVVSLGAHASGAHTLTIPNLDLPANGFCRILLEAGNQGRYWTRETGHWSQAEFPGTAADAPAGTAVGTITVASPASRPVTYQILPGDDAALFSINHTTGALTVATSLPDPLKPFYTLEVEALLDGHSGWRSRVNVTVGPGAGYTGGAHPRFPILESFAGSAGAALSAGSGGTGWNGAWSGDATWMLGAPNPLFPGIAGSGLKAIVGDQGTNVARPFTEPIEISTNLGGLPEIWITTTMEIALPIAVGHSVRLELLNGGTQVGYLGKKVNGTLGFELGGSAFQDISGSLGTGSGTVGLWHFALHLEANGTGGVDATLYTTKSTEPFTVGNPLTYLHTASTTIAGPVTFDAIRLRRHNNSTSAIDEICIAPTFAAALVDHDGDGNPDITDPDDDNDEMPDIDELIHSLNPYSAADAPLDYDLDGYTNLAEIVFGSNPNSGTEQPGYLTAGFNVMNEFAWTLFGREGRQYSLWRSTTLQAASWTLCDTTTTLTADGDTTLTDPTPPPARAYYRASAIIP